MVVARECGVVIVAVYAHALEKHRVQLGQLIQQRQKIVHIPARGRQRRDMTLTKRSMWGRSAAFRN